MAINPFLKPYIKLVEFLGMALGPDYEIALHDLTDKNRSIIAIANSHVSGRSIGAPLTNMALGVLRDKSYEQTDYRINYRGVSASGKELRSNTLFIKDRGTLVGMLCINFDDTRFRALGAQVMGLCHPDAYLENLPPTLIDGSAQLILQGAPEQFRNSTEAVAADAVQRELDGIGISPDRLTSEERQQIIAAMDRDGIFLLKGAVKEVASRLGCSQASVYRYLSHVKNSHPPQ